MDRITKTLVIGERVWWRTVFGSLVDGRFDGLDADARAWVTPAGMSCPMHLDPMLLFTLPHYRMEQRGDTWEWERL